MYQLSSRELQRTLRHAIQRQQIQNENRRLVGELQIAARSDSLTGLLNRHAMIEEFENCWQASLSNDSPLACVILDVDYFKNINDQFGHLAGDQVLRKIARILSNHTRPGDYIARYGGEEFCVILVEANEQQAVEWSESARTALSSFRFELSGKSRTVTASFGAAQRCEHTQCIEELIDLADQALLVAKGSGRDQVFSFSTSGQSVLRSGATKVIQPLSPTKPGRA